MQYNYDITYEKYPEYNYLGLTEEEIRVLRGYLTSNFLWINLLFCDSVDVTMKRLRHWYVAINGI